MKKSALRLVPQPGANRIPLIRADLPALEDVEGPFREILGSGRVSNFGKFVTQFEEETGRFLGTKTVTVSSGTMGLIFSLQALGLKPKQKVLLPSFSFMATAQAVLYAGGIPVFCEIEDDMLLSIKDVEAQLEKNSDIAGIIPVHTYGRQCHVKELRTLVDSISKKRSTRPFVVYDGAHAFGAAVGGKRVGSFGDAEVFSLSATKAFVAVEGGLIASENEKLIRQLKKMRNYGIEENYNTHYPGLNGKMSEFHAVIGLHNLSRIEEIMATRTQKAAYYAKAIESSTPFKVVRGPETETHTFKDFTIQLPVEWQGKRDSLSGYLRENEIETRAYFFPAIHEQDYFKSYANRALPKTESLCRRVITLPFFTTITESQMDRVVEVLKEAMSMV